MHSATSPSTSMQIIPIRITGLKERNLPAESPKPTSLGLSMSRNSSVGRVESTEHHLLTRDEEIIIQLLKQLGLVRGNNGLSKKLLDVIQKLEAQQMEHNHSLTRDEEIIIQLLKQMGLVETNNRVTNKLLDVIRKLESRQNILNKNIPLDTKHTQQIYTVPSSSKSTKPSMNLAKIAPLPDDKNAKQEKSSQRIILSEIKMEFKPTFKSIISIITPVPFNKNKYISIFGTKIASYLTDDDYKRFTATSRDFQTSFKSPYQYRTIWAHKAFNALSHFDMQVPNEYRGYKFYYLISYDENTKNINHQDIESSCSLNVIKCATLAPCKIIAGALDCALVLPLFNFSACCIENCCRDRRESFTCSSVMSCWFLSCYLMTGGYVIKNTIQSAACLSGYAAGAAKDACCDGLRPLDKSKHIEIPLPSVARSLFTPKTQKNAVQSPQMTRDDGRPSNRH